MIKNFIFADKKRLFFNNSGDNVLFFMFEVQDLVFERQIKTLILLFTIFEIDKILLNLSFLFFYRAYIENVFANKIML